MPDDELNYNFVFLLQLNHGDVAFVAGATKEQKAEKEKTGDKQGIEAQLDHWTPSSNGHKCQWLAVTGEYDIIVLAEGGTPDDAFDFALYLTNTGDYQVTTLNAFSPSAFTVKAGCQLPYHPHRR